MQYLELHEKIQHGTVDFPLEYHYLDESHPRYIMDYHWHTEFEIIRVLKGQLDMTLDEEKRPVSAGDLVFVHGGILHSGMPVDCIYECLVFDLNTFLKLNPLCTSYLQQILDRSALIFDYFSPEYQAIQDVIDHVFAAMSRAEEGYELIAFGELLHFFGIIFSEGLYRKSPPKAPSRKGHQKILQLKNVLDYMDQNYSNQITLEQLAASASMSPKYFCRFFHQMTHRTPMDYLNYQRIERACYELATTEHSVTEVAYNCGFNDLSYFIKTFRRYKGMTPGKYQV